MGKENAVYLLVISCWMALVLLCIAGSAATTEVHLIKYGPDATTILSEKTVTSVWMEKNLPVFGDGTTHYYHQGPVFIDDPDPVREETLRWNTAEDKNVREKDMGAVKGTSLRDLCDLAGGMQPGDTVTLKAEDGFSKKFAYQNVYRPSDRQGTMVITWYRDSEGYVPDYRQGMRLVFFADNSTNPWGLHVFGNWDWHESAGPENWYYYQQGQPPEKYPTTTGLSVQYISEIRINSVTASSPAATGTTAPAQSSPAKSPFGLPLILLSMTLAGGFVILRHRRDSQ